MSIRFTMRKQTRNELEEIEMKQDKMYLNIKYIYNKNQGFKIYIICLFILIHIN